MKYLISVFIVAVMLSSVAYSQTEKVSKLLKLVAQGKIDDVQKEMPKLLADYPNEPGVKLLQAVLMEDGIKANEVYRSIVKNYPNSEWADDAQWRVVQFYAIIGDTANAKKELDLFRKQYPKSEFLAPATDVVHSSIGSAKYNFKSKIEASKIAKIESEENPRYGLQVGVYSTKSAAEYERKRFLSMKLRTDIVEKDINGEIKYAVVIGNYSSIEAAESAKKEVESKCECTPIIYKKEPK